MNEIVDEKMLNKAKALIKIVHKDAVYVIKGIERPYYCHCFWVADILKQYAESNVNLNLCIIVAYLHDSIEDTDTTYEYIANNFNSTIADCVLALTKDKNIEKSIQMIDSINRIKNLNIKEIAMVKMADRIVNLENIPNYWSIEKANQYLEESYMIFKSLSYASKNLANKLSQSIEEYKIKIKEKQDFLTK